MRSAHPLRADTPRISRFPIGMHPYMHRVFARAGSDGISRWRCRRCGLPPARMASAPRSWFPFRGSLARPARTPVNASPATLRSMTHDSEPVWVATPSPYDSCIHNIPSISPPHSRGKTPPPASASQPASIRLIPPPASSTITARADSQTLGRQSGSTRTVAYGGVLRSSRVARVRNAPQPDPADVAKQY